MNTQINNSHKTPLPKAIVIWINERVPIPLLIWAMLMYFAAAKLAQWSITGTAFFVPLDILGMVAMASYFIMMRALDEHKDFDDDNRNFPDRPVQRGLITLNQLKGVALGCLFLQLGTSLVFDQGFGAVTLYWLFSIAWLTLMTKEFFIEAWLRKHIVIYALSHMFIILLIGLWLLQMGAGKTQIVPLDYLPFLALLFLASLSAELIRKTRAPEAEREGVDSYSRVFGYRGSAVLVMLCLALLWGLFQLYLSQLGHPFGSLYSLILLSFTVLAILALGHFMLKPSVKGSKMNEAGVGFSALVGLILLTIAVLQYGQ